MVGLQGVAVYAVLFASAGAGALHAQALMLEASGPMAGAAFGRTVAVLGDVNGDGRGDLLVAAPFDGTSEASGSDGGYVGSVHALSGVDGSELWSAQGEEPSELFGWAIAAAGDVNGDGIPDALIGAPNHDDFRGRVLVCSGDTGEVLAELFGHHPGDHFGGALSAAGDVDDDGHADIAIGAWNEGDSLPGQGMLRILSGANGAQLLEVLGAHAFDHFASALAATGDVDLDGVPDVLAGAEQMDLDALTDDVGGAVMISVKFGIPLWTLLGETFDEGFGHSLAGPGDITGDGAPEALIGVPFSSDFGENGGKAMVVTGAEGLLVQNLVPPAWYGEYGISLCGAGDADEDGVLDVAIGAATGGDPLGDGPGRVYVQSGVDGSLLDDFVGTSVLGGFGWGLASGDLDADGVTDLVVGAPWAGGSPVGPGKLEVYSGDLWVTLGLGTPGTGGTPQFVVEGEPVISSPVSFMLADAQPGAPAILIIGASKLMAPFKGGTLVPNPDLLAPLVHVGGDGSISLAGTWVPGPLSGMQLFFQWWVADAGADHGWASTPGVQLTVP
ncbi:MAG TPA: hypothetical protein VFY71_09110 [Planctomycetota bacterium]|nr:hypothetical protein [Planctomycetota bacterium]